MSPPGPARVIRLYSAAASFAFLAGCRGFLPAARPPAKR